LRGQQDNYVRVFHTLDLTKLVTRQVDEWRRNAEGVGVGCWLDKGVHQLQITLKGQHITAECGYPCRSDFRRESARAFHPVAELGLYPASEVLCVPKKIAGCVDVPLRTFLFFAVLFDEVGESVEDSGVMEKV